MINESFQVKSGCVIVRFVSDNLTLPLYVELVIVLWSVIVLFIIGNLINISCSILLGEDGNQ